MITRECITLSTILAHYLLVVNNLAFVVTSNHAELCFSRIKPRFANARSVTGVKRNDTIGRTLPDTTGRCNSQSPTQLNSPPAVIHPLALSLIT